MDILAHTLWANYGGRAANKLISKKKKNIPKINIFWVSFMGVFPDFFAFGIPFFIILWQIITGDLSLSSFGSHHAPAGVNFDLSAYLYQYSHSLVVWALVFIVFWFIYKRPRFELLGWALHIIIDIPSHSIDFFPTPFLFPISEYRFPYGIQWSNRWYMIINYSLLLAISIFLIIRHYKNKKKNNLV